ncbi:MAG: hypothetical protein KGI08_10880, partial [Thaumarchaeota archaeon]|nr:hypothetical protein [Nitrososphaerota archaeon]
HSNHNMVYMRNRMDIAMIIIDDSHPVITKDEWEYLAEFVDNIVSDDGWHQSPDIMYKIRDKLVQIAKVLKEHKVDDNAQ